jgi:hypothetical protein
VRDGNRWLTGLGPVASINVGVTQNIAQLQNIKVNVLNNNGVIGAGFGGFGWMSTPSNGRTRKPSSKPCRQ